MYDMEKLVSNIVSEVTDVLLTHGEESFHTVYIYQIPYDCVC